MGTHLGRRLALAAIFVISPAWAATAEVGPGDDVEAAYTALLAIPNRATPSA
jgi:hypothetical protein